MHEFRARDPTRAIHAHTEGSAHNSRIVNPIITIGATIGFSERAIRVASREAILETADVLGDAMLMQ